MNQALQDIWTNLSPFYGELVGLVFSLLGTFVVFLMRPRVKLIFGRANNSRNVITVPTSGNDDESSIDREGDADGDADGGHSSTEIYVEKFFLQNTGRKPANNVEFVLSTFPNDITVWQPRDVKFKSVEKGNCLISIPQVAPRELVIIDCVYLNQRAAFVTSVKCAEAMGKEVAFHTVRRFNNWINGIGLAAMIGGLAFFLQIFFKLLGA